MSQEIFRKWERESMEHQKSMSQLLGDRMWDEYDIPSHREILETKLGVLLFGKTLDKDYKMSLTKEERILVEMLRQKSEKHSGFKYKIRLAFIFVSVHIDDHSHTVVPLIRVMVDKERHTSNNTFIDHLGRVYNSWDDYRDNHTWKKCWLCVPSHGYYDCDEDNIVLWNHFERDNVSHIVSNVINNVCKTCVIGGAVIAAIPPLSPLGGFLSIVGSIVLYRQVTDIIRIKDRINHDQTINITDEQARKLWLDILGNICAVGGMVLSNFATWSIIEGVTIPITVGIVIGGFKLTGGAIKGIKLVNSFSNLSEKTTAKEYFLLMTDVFLFYHCVTRLNGQSIATFLQLTIPIEIILTQNQVKFPSTTLCKDFKVHKESIRKISEIKLLTELAFTW